MLLISKTYHSHLNKKLNNLHRLQLFTQVQVAKAGYARFA